MVFGVTQNDGQIKNIFCLIIKASSLKNDFHLFNMVNYFFEFDLLFLVHILSHSLLFASEVCWKLHIIFGGHRQLPVIAIFRTNQIPKYIFNWNQFCQKKIFNKSCFMSKQTKHKIYPVKPKRQLAIKVNLGCTHWILAF
jgi:hypothetical protein